MGVVCRACLAEELQRDRRYRRPQLRSRFYLPHKPDPPHQTCHGRVDQDRLGPLLNRRAILSHHPGAGPRYAHLGELRNTLPARQDRLHPYTGRRCFVALPSSMTGVAS